MTPAEEAQAIAEYDVEWTDALLFGTKVCSACGAEKPACSSYFFKDKDNEDGLKASCKACYSERVARRYREKQAAKGGAS